MAGQAGNEGPLLPAQLEDAQPSEGWRGLGQSDKGAPGVCEEVTATWQDAAAGCEGLERPPDGPGMGVSLTCQGTHSPRMLLMVTES